MRNPIEKELSENVAKNLKKLRSVRGMSLEEVARLLGFEPSLLEIAEKGERSLSLANLVAMAQLFGITVDELIRE